MQYQNHGVIAEEGGEVGAGVWTALNGASKGIAMFRVVPADSEMSKEVHGPYFVRPIPELSLDFTRANQRYVRYEITDQRAFSRLCYQSMKYGGMPGICLSPQSTDKQAVLTLEDLWGRVRAINGRAISNRPVTSIVQKRPVYSDWFYAIGFYFHSAITFFVSSDQRIKQSVADASTNVPKLRIIEEW